MSFLEVKEVSKQYVGHLALDRVSISVDEGRIFGLLGPNGAGKTTLIRIINAITMPDSGEVLIDGHRLTLADTSVIGYLPEERGLYKKMKVGEQALYLCRLKGMSKTDALRGLRHWFERFEIQGWWDKKVEELSKGMAQKVQFITTVLHRPRLLIFDEPFSGFDPVNAELLKREILKLRDEGATIIFSTHNMDSVERLCDDIALINHAKVVLSGPISDIRARYREHIYRAVVSAKSVAPDPALFSVLSSESKADGLHLSVKVNEGTDANSLLTSLMACGEIVSFEETLPSMNDIFIRTVSGGEA